MDICISKRLDVTLSWNNETEGGRGFRNRIYLHTEKIAKKRKETRTRRGMSWILCSSSETKLFFRKKKKKNLHRTVNAFFFFSFNLYTVDLTLRPRRKIGRAENRRYFRLSKLQLEIFVGNKELWYHSMSRDVDL